MAVERNERLERISDTALELEQAERIAELEARLKKIGDYAHDNSTGPAVPDALWTIREMAYDG